MPKKFSIIIILFVITSIIHFAGAQFLPVIQDEAYYFYWSLFPDFGYYDHPPLVSWLSYGSSLLPSSPISSRFGFLLLES